MIDIIISLLSALGFIASPDAIDKAIVYGPNGETNGIGVVNAGGTFSNPEGGNTFNFVLVKDEKGNYTLTQR
jgi:hypothetical protein